MQTHDRFFARANRRFLSFGFFLAFLSSVGQTYFIGVFSPEIQGEFGFDSGSWGRIYMVGTLLSAALIGWSGGLIDRLDLRLFTTMSLLGLSLACYIMSSVTTVSLLIVAIFMLRQFGQGLSSHAGITAMTRYHQTHRGKAISLATIGFAFGEAVLPLLAVFAIDHWGWRNTYALASTVILASTLIALWLLKGHQKRHAHYALAVESNADNRQLRPDYSCRKMLSEPRFYWLLPTMIVPPLITTAVFFFPAEIARSKGWSNLWITGHYWLYSLSAVIAMIASGVLIDRLSARKIVRIFFLPLVMALTVIAFSNLALIVWPFMIFLGASSGLYLTGLSALWAELYGTRNLGRIKSLTNAVMVFSSALGPALVGSLLSWQVSFQVIFLALTGSCICARVMLAYGLREPLSTTNSH